MRLFISKAAALGLCACALLAACSPQDGSAPAAATVNNNNNNNARAANAKATAEPAAPAPAQNAEETRRVSIQETQAAIAEGKAVVVDVRDQGAYDANHIKGAILVPLSQVEKRAGELPKDKLIITYCA